MARQIDLFCKALIEKDLDGVRRTIEEGANVNKIYNNGAALHFAVWKDDLQLAQLLLAHGADVSLKNNKRLTPLHAACISGKNVNYNMCKLLVEHGADCNSKADDETTPFHQALMFHSLKVVQLLVDHGADIKVTGEYGMTAIHYAACNLNVDVLEFVVNLGFNIEESDDHGFSALHHAALFSNSGGCEFLLERGALVNKKCHDPPDWTPLTFAVTRGGARIVQILLNFGANVFDKLENDTVLKIAFNNGRYEVMRILIRHIARIKYLNLGINENDRQAVENIDYCYNYFKMCLLELEKMKGEKFYNHVSLLRITTGSKKVISGYARNEELVRVLEAQCWDYKFPIYFVWLRKRVYDAVKKHRLRNAAATILDDIFMLDNPYHPTTQKILDYLRDEDLKLLYTMSSF